MILFLDPTGPKITYEPNGQLHIENLNPEVSTSWRMTRGDMVKLAVQCLRAALMRRSPS